MRLIRTYDQGVQQIGDGSRWRLLVVCYYDNDRSFFGGVSDDYYALIDPHTPDSEARKLRANLRRDWKAGVKTMAGVGKPIRTGTDEIPALRDGWSKRTDR